MFIHAAVFKSGYQIDDFIKYFNTHKFTHPDI